MCDYCDCRRIPEIALLGRQHETIQEMADEALAVAKSGGAGLADAIDRLREALDPHVRREEEGVFTLAKEGGFATANYVDDLEEDHARFAALLADPGFLEVARLEAFVDELYRHISVEEYDLFPVAAQMVSDERWALVPVA
ncbi:MAG: hemerythrin domain-containing protein [Acidimicrobiia bacterium]